MKVGDIVQLMTGGPKMTVERVNESTEPRVACVWFSGDTCNRQEFPAGTLQAVAAPVSAPAPAKAAKGS